MYLLDTKHFLGDLLDHIPTILAEGFPLIAADGLAFYHNLPG